MEKNIVLTGFMGTGKSSVGSKIAERMGREFIDMDREIEKLTGLSINDLFRRYGEIRFRSEEQLMAQKLSRRSGLVIATGGGVVLEEDNMEALRQNGIMICLQAAPEDIFARVSRKKGTRPLLKKNLTLQDIIDMLEERASFYQKADLQVNTSGKDLDQVVLEIIKKTTPYLGEKGRRK
ncbi:shikimate kinase [Syntrophomonas erecta]